ncbi:hypothetical protein WA026_000049 [Henosepilachna vigintioctopunctata]|uniref:Amidase domain-containing protein n=1 Tax=Henosepilachna vigintioctopunctata TaxID=420089 RepID=A0AAW1V608_9CUCU
MSELRKYVRAMYRLIFSVVNVVSHFLFSLTYRQCGEKAPPITDLLLLDSASKIALKIRTKKVKCSDVLESFIARIKQINPVLNCVVAERFAEARQEAKNVDELLKSDTIPDDVLAREKPFLGVPFTTKDCIAVKGMIHTAGLVARKHIIASDDATTVKHLKNAGAIPIALTNISELCMWWESDNNIHGRSRNPYDTNRIVGGSSGGEGCIQAAAGSAFGVGSDIGGSIRMPSFFNGVFGHKPSPFTVSNDGQFPPPSSGDHDSFLGVGPMCRHAEDLLPLMKILSGGKQSQLKLDLQVNINEVDIFYQEDDQGSVAVSPVNKEIKALFGKLVTYFDKAHSRKLTKLELKRFAKSQQMWFAGMKTQSGPTFHDQLSGLNGRISLPWELLKWCFRCSNHTFIALSTALVENAGEAYGSSKHTYLLRERDKLREELLEILGDNGVFIYPTHPTVAPYHNEPIFKPFNFSYTGIINVLGLPATHIPMGLNSEGIPIGLQVVSAPNNDRLCLAIARELEKAFGGWVPPQLE